MTRRLIYSTLFLAVLLPLGVYPEGWNSQASSSSSAPSAINSFLGRWDLSIRTPKGELPSWIEVSEEQGRPKVVMVGVSEHATPLAKVEIKGGEIEFLSPKEEEGFANDTLFKGKVVGGQLVGATSSPSGVSWRWTGHRAPSLKRTSAPKWGKPVSLFNGKDFAGWRFSDPNRAKTWTVEDGTLVEGRIDCAWTDGTSWTVVDYKTDRREKRSLAQVQLYALALQRATGLPVRGIVLEV